MRHVLCGNWKILTLVSINPKLRQGEILCIMEAGKHPPAAPWHQNNIIMRTHGQKTIYGSGVPSLWKMEKVGGQCVTEELLTEEEMDAIRLEDKNCGLVKGQVFLGRGGDKGG